MYNRKKNTSPYLVQIKGPELQAHEHDWLSCPQYYVGWRNGERWQTPAQAYANCVEIEQTTGNHLKTRIVIDDGKGPIHVCQD